MYINFQHEFKLFSLVTENATGHFKKLIDCLYANDGKPSAEAEQHRTRVAYEYRAQMDQTVYNNCKSWLVRGILAKTLLARYAICTVCRAAKSFMTKENIDLKQLSEARNETMPLDNRTNCEEVKQKAKNKQNYLNYFHSAVKKMSAKSFTRWRLLAWSWRVHPQLACTQR